MGYLLLALLLSFSNVQATETTYNISDDGYVNVPLPFAFPFYDQVFTNSFFFSNGVVGFLDPRTGATSGQTFTASPFNQLNPSQFNYIIAPLWTDLINTAGGNFKTVSTDTSMQYQWNNIAEYGRWNNLNTFDLTITDSGSITVNYENVNIDAHSIGVGYTGNIANGEAEQTGWYPYGASYTTPDFTNWTANPAGGQTQIVPVTPVQDPCDVNPLSSPSCPLYAEYYYAEQCSLNPLYDIGCAGYSIAYYNQQCSLNPLYDQDCPGYSEAYYDEQCSINPLYDSGCIGYAEAYYDQQCSIDPLYDSGCTGYDIAYHDQQCGINPLYSQDCIGYDVAYLDQQCGINPLYDSVCPGYDEAYLAQQCSLDTLYSDQCPGYDVAYYEHQCTINPLYDSGCPGYDTAYYNQQCSLDPLYDSGCNGYDSAYYEVQCFLDPLYDNQCPGYTEAYYTQQCTLDPLYDSGCPGYEELYYQTYVLPQQEALTESITESTTSVATNDVAATVPSVTGDTVVDSVLNTNTVTTIDPTSPISNVINTMSTLPVSTTSTTTESSTSNSSSSSSSNESKSEKPAKKEVKDRPATAQEKRDKVKAEMVEKGKELAKEVGKAATMEEQQKTQDLAMKMIGFNPDFTTYQKAPQQNVPFYKPFEIYKHQKQQRSSVRNGLAQQILHDKMVEMQYRSKK